MKRYLIVDTETTGLPLHYDAPFHDVNNWPRIIQLAWELCWENGDTIKKVCELVEPDGWRFPTGKFWIDNGFNEADCILNGKPMKDLLIDLCKAMNTADVMIAHNLSYDKPIIECEMFRYNVLPKQIAREHPFGLRPEGVKLQKECTKLLSTPILKLPGIYGQYSWPKLEVAYEYCFGKPFTDGHDAGADVQACKEIYLWIQSLNDIM